MSLVHYCLPHTDPLGQRMSPAQMDPVQRPASETISSIADPEHHVTRPGKTKKRETHGEGHGFDKEAVPSLLNRTVQRR